MWKKILVPHDFSLCAQRALELAVELAKVHGATITLVHVSPLPPNVSPSALITPAGSKTPVRIDEHAAAAAREKLDVLAGSIRARGVEARTLAFAALDDVAGELLTVATDLGVDAIVLGTHGRTGLSHMLLGSVTEKVVRRSTIPVLTLRSIAPEAEPTNEERDAEDELSG